MSDCYNRGETRFAKILSAVLGDRADEAAGKLIRRYGNLDTMLSCPESELCASGGFCDSAALLIKLIGYVNARRVTDEFMLKTEFNELELLEYVRALFVGLTVETVYLVLLDCRGRVISAEYMGEGTIGASDVYPRRLLECAIKSKASAVILAHNHPRGYTTPSKDDIAATKKLQCVFNTAGVRFLSHYIVADGNISAIDFDGE